MVEFNHIIVTASPVELITTADAKLHLRMDGDDENSSIDRMISSIKSEIETYLGRCLIETEIMQPYPGWGRVIFLPTAPVISIEKIEYYDAANAKQTLPAQEYEWINAAVSPVICEASGKTWPSLFDRLAPVEVTFKCGYGASAMDVPMDIIDAAYLMLGDRFKNRGATLEQSSVAMRLLEKHRNFT